MKNYKQKYEEALERCKKEFDFNNLAYPLIKERLERIFPELKESGDDKIRKAILELVKQSSHILNPMNQKSMISWLEKQGDVEYVFRPLAGCDIYSAAESAVEQQKSGKKIILAFNGAYIPVDKKTADEIVNEYYSWCEKQGEQKTNDKVEPKFKVGDRIYDKRDSYNRNVIREVGKDYYINAFAQKMDMAYTNANFEFLEHLEDEHNDSKPAAWSEEDEPQKELAETYLAVFDKKFPTLPTLKGKELADYKNFLNKCQQILGLKYWSIRPLQAKLFEKLSLLWAVWGAEHLKGLGQTNEDTDNKSHDWSKEDEGLFNNIEESLLAYKIIIMDNDTELANYIEKEINFLRSLKDRIQPQPKQEWSEEDGEMIETLNEYVKNLDILFSEIKIGDKDILSKEFREKVQYWLKSLKERVQPQPKQEWSEEDENMLNFYEKDYNNLLGDWKAKDVIEMRMKFRKWLKSLKQQWMPQPHWKPSDEQLRPLGYAIDYFKKKKNDTTYLESLYNDLKKL